MRKSQKNKGAILIARNAYNWQYGGAEQYTINMALALREYGYTPVVATRVPELLEKCKAEGVITFKNWWFRNTAKWPHILGYLGLWPILIGQYLWVMKRYGVVVCLLSSRDDQIFGTIAGKMIGINAIWVDHADAKMILNFPHVRELYRKAMRKAFKMIIASKGEYSKIAPNLTQDLIDNVTIINNGAIRHQSEPLAKPTCSVLGLYVGRIEEEKGLLDLMHAAIPAVKKNPNLHFWLVGKGRAEDEVRELIEKAGLDANFGLWGHQSDIGPFLAAADFFLYPTHHDASPLAPVEALLAGLPVVATEIGGIPEVVNDSCGILVESKNPKALGKAIESVAGDVKLRKKLSEGAIKRGNEFEFGHVVSKYYIPLFEEAAK